MGDNGIIIGDDLHRRTKKFNGGWKSLRCFDAMFTVLSDSVELNSTLTGVRYRVFSYFTYISCVTSRL